MFIALASTKWFAYILWLLLSRQGYNAFRTLISHAGLDEDVPTEILFSSYINEDDTDNDTEACYDSDSSSEFV